MTLTPYFCPLRFSIKQKRLLLRAPRKSGMIFAELDAISDTNQKPNVMDMGGNQSNASETLAGLFVVW